MKRLVALGTVTILAAVGVRVWWSLRPKPAPPTPVAPVVRSEPAPIDPEQLRTQVETAVAGRPKDYALRMKAAEFYVRMGAHPAALPHLKAASQLSPREIMPWLALGDAYTLLQDYSQAERAYQRAAALDPENPLVARGKGELLGRRGRWREASGVLLAALAKHPGHLELITVLANVYIDSDQAGKAIDLLKSALAKTPGRPDVRALLAEAYAKARRLEAAIQEHREVVRMEPRADESWGRIGLYLVRLNRCKEARPALEQAIALNPQQPYYYCALGDSYLQDPDEKQGLERALEQYRRGLAVDARHPKALAALAGALMRKEDPASLKEAAQLLKTLVAAYPDEMHGFYRLYEVSRRLGNEVEAQQALRKFQRLAGEHQRKTREKYRNESFADTAEAHLRLAERYLQRGDYQLAAESFRLALERDPQSERARKGLQQASARTPTSSPESP